MDHEHDQMQSPKPVYKRWWFWPTIAYALLTFVVLPNLYMWAVYNRDVALTGFGALLMANWAAGSWWFATWCDKQTARRKQRP